MWLSRGMPATIFRIFLSSGDDVLHLRELVVALVEDAVAPVLMQRNLSVRIEVDIWERTSPHRIQSGESGNAEFVRRAKAAHMVLCLLEDALADGTREELEAVLNEEDIQLSVVWCVDRASEWPSTPAGQWLELRKDEERLMVARAGLVDQHGPVVAIVRLLIDAVLSATREDRDGGVLHERR
jgi:hypothetical protein